MRPEGMQSRPITKADRVRAVNSMLRRGPRPRLRITKGQADAIRNGTATRHDFVLVGFWRWKSRRCRRCGLRARHVPSPHA